MTPEELAERIIQQSTQSSLTDYLDSISSQITEEIVTIIRKESQEYLYRDAHKSLALAEIAMTVASYTQIEKAQALSTWARANALLNLNRYQEAIENFTHLEKFFLEEGELTHAVGLQINQVLAFTYLGNYEDALRLATQCEDTCRQLEGQSAKYLANLFSILGWVYREMGDPDKALTIYDEGERIYSSLDYRQGVAWITMSKANTLAELDRFHEAREHLLRARQTFHEEKLKPELAKVDWNLGRLFFKLGRYQDALHYLWKARNFFSSIMLPIEVAGVDLSFAQTYGQLSLYPEMLRLATHATQVFNKNNMRREYIQGLLYQGIAYRHLSQQKLAERVLSKARRELCQQGAMWKLWLLDTDRAELALASGNYLLAQQIAQRVVEQIENSRYPALVTRLDLIFARCELYKEDPNFLVAKRFSQRAKELSESKNLAELKISSYYLLSIINDRIGLIKQAWNEIQNAIKESEQLRSLISHDDLSIGFTEEKLSIYEMNVFLSYKLVRKRQATLSDLFNSIGLLRSAPLLLDNSKLENVNEALSNKEKDQLNDLREAWHWYQNRMDLSSIVQFRGQELAPKVHQLEWRKRLGEIENDIVRIVRSRYLKASRTDFFNTLEKHSYSSLDELQQHLALGAVFLLYFVTNDFLHVMIINSHNVKIVEEMGSVQRLMRDLQSWTFHIKYFTTNLNIETRQTIQYLRHFYDNLIRPIAPLLEGYKQIFVCLPPKWQSIPFSALYDGEQYLIEKFQFSYISGPNFFLTSNYSNTNQLNWHATIVGYSGGGVLPFTIREARIVSSHLSSWQKNILLEENSTIEAFSNYCYNSNLIHLATHSVFRPDNPQFSWMQLANERLTVFDLNKLKFNKAPLIVLSACETGRGNPKGGGLLGMGRAFLAAGASNLIVSLWKVDDQKTYELMDDFYRTFSKEASSLKDVARILQLTQLEAISKKMNPINWGCFVHIGG